LLLLIRYLSLLLDLRLLGLCLLDDRRGEGKLLALLNGFRDGELGIKVVVVSLNVGGGNGCVEEVVDEERDVRRGREGGRADCRKREATLATVEKWQREIKRLTNLLSYSWPPCHALKLDVGKSEAASLNHWQHLELDLLDRLLSVLRRCIVVL
jgi:hypothetical protein